VKVLHAHAAAVAPCELGEGPCWLADGSLSWVDILGECVLVGVPDRSGGLAVVAGHDIGLHVGAALPLDRPRGGWLLAAGSGFALLDAAGGVEQLATPERDSAGVRMNDAACDAAGRMWAGSMAYDERPGAGSLFRVDLDGRVTRVLRDLQISNGIDWSPDNATMYLADSGHRVVYRAAYDLDRGLLGRLEPLIVAGADDGAPDGLAVDGEAMIWVAFWGGSRVECFDPSGRSLRRVEVAAPLTTSCCFGGADGRTLYITTARAGMTAEQLQSSPLSGRVFAARVEAPGPPARPFRGELPLTLSEAC
jgi:sugar lactone lactonase YvrE